MAQNVNLQNHKITAKHRFFTSLFFGLVQKSLKLFTFLYIFVASILLDLWCCDPSIENQESRQMVALSISIDVGMRPVEN